MRSHIDRGFYWFHPWCFACCLPPRTRAPSLCLIVEKCSGLYILDNDAIIQQHFYDFLTIIKCPGWWEICARWHAAASDLDTNWTAWHFVRTLFFPFLRIRREENVVLDKLQRFVNSFSNSSLRAFDSHFVSWDMSKANNRIFLAERLLLNFTNEKSCFQK